MSERYETAYAGVKEKSVLCPPNPRRFDLGQLTLAVTGRGERMRASGPVDRGVRLHLPPAGALPTGTHSFATRR